MASGPFVHCTVCNTDWATRDQFLRDETVSLVGYQANFINLEKGLFLFNHSCRMTLAVRVESFADLHVGPVFAERLSGTPDCSGYCLHRNALQACPNKCECVYVRDVLQQLQGPKFEGS